MKRIARVGDAWVMPPGFTLPMLQERQGVLKAMRAELGKAAFADWPLRREAFVADTDEKAWDLYAPALRHEYGHVYRSLYPGYPENDTTANLRKWGEGTFVVGAPDTVAAKLKEYGAALGTTEFLLRYQLPHVSHGAMKDCLRGLKDVMTKLS